MIANNDRGKERTVLWFIFLCDAFSTFCGFKNTLEP